MQPYLHRVERKTFTMWYHKNKICSLHPTQIKGYALQQGELAFD